MMKEVSSLMRSNVNLLAGQYDWPGRAAWRAEIVNRLLPAAMYYLAEEAIEEAEILARRGTE